MQQKRILWLYSHSTLMKSEVAIIRELGYEVYIPKVIPFDVSVAVDWESDRLLSIPVEALEILNRVDFYGQRIPDEAMEVMNRYFSMAIFGIFIEPLKSLVLHYKGILIFHPFGLEDGMSYSKLIELNTGIWLLKKMEELGDRFWFGQSYENLMEIECDFFKRRTINLPIGMLDTEIVDKWHGGAKKVLFICPRIRISPYYEQIYKQFKIDFKDIPHSIGGAQPIAVQGDKCILGYLPQKEYEDLYPSHSVMFYHAVNKRHIHYHPFEAVKCGLPLVFMGGGLIDELGGRDLPGRCMTLKEAQEKCRRIIKGDKRLAERIRSAQGVLMEKMSYDFCLKEWKKALEIIEKKSQNIPDWFSEKKYKKVAFILPQMYRGGVLDYTLRLIQAFAKGMESFGEKIEIVFAVPEDMVKKHYDEIKVAESCGAVIRAFSWEIVDKSRIEELTNLAGHPLSVYRKEYTLMNDGIRYFEDCDFLLFMADRVPANLFFLKPYGVVIHDYMRRYVPEDLEETYEQAIMDFVRKSECNFTTSVNAMEDCIQYVGAKRERIHLLPLFFEDISKEKGETEKGKEPYFVWSTNISIHKNHKVALKALADYYQAGGKLRCYVTGINTKLFKKGVSLDGLQLPSSQIQYILEIREMIDNNVLMKKNVRFMGQLDKTQYYNVVRNARFMIHPGMADNGNGAVVDAAFLGVPSISSDYPAMRNIDTNMHLGLCFFDKEDPRQLKERLLWAEDNEEEMRKRLPKIELLRKHTIDDEELCKKIYQKLMQYLCI